MSKRLAGAAFERSPADVVMSFPSFLLQSTLFRKRWPDFGMTCLTFDIVAQPGRLPSSACPAVGATSADGVPGGIGADVDCPRTAPPKFPAAA